MDNWIDVSNVIDLIYIVTRFHNDFLIKHNTVQTVLISCRLTF